MAAVDLLIDGFDRVRESVHSVLAGATDEELTVRLDPEANTIAWLTWHLTRVQDDHIAGVAGSEQVWTADGWHERFGLPFAPEAIGYGDSAADVAAVRASADLLTGYHDAVVRRTVDYRVVSTTANWIGSSTTAGIRRSRWPYGWSASCPMTCSTSARPRSSGGASGVAEAARHADTGGNRHCERRA